MQHRLLNRRVNQVKCLKAGPNCNLADDLQAIIRREDPFIGIFSSGVGELGNNFLDFLRSVWLQNDFWDFMDRFLLFLLNFAYCQHGLARRNLLRK